MRVRHRSLFNPSVMSGLLQKGETRLQFSIWGRRKRTNGWDGNSIYLLIAWRNLKTLLPCLSSSNWQNRYTIFIKQTKKQEKETHDKQTSFDITHTFRQAWTISDSATSALPRTSCCMLEQSHESSQQHEYERQTQKAKLTQRMETT